MPAAPPQEGDAALLAATQLHIPNNSSKNDKQQKSSSINAPGPGGSQQQQQQHNSATESLAKSNLLRLETNELINESKLHIHPPTGSSDNTTTTSSSHNAAVHYEAKWSPSVRTYIHDIKHIIHGLGGVSLCPNVALLPPNSNNVKERGENKYRIPLLSDKFHKSQHHQHTNNNSSNNNPLTSWSFPFHGGKSLHIQPIGSFGQVGNAGLANVHANGCGGDVVPVLDLAVLFHVNVGDNDGGEEGEAGFVAGKDYLNHRYTDVSFAIYICLCWY